MTSYARFLGFPPERKTRCVDFKCSNSFVANLDVLLGFFGIAGSYGNSYS